MVTIAASETLPRQPRMPFLVGYSHRGVLAGELPLTWPVLRTGLVAGDVRFCHLLLVAVRDSCSRRRDELMVTQSRPNPARMRSICRNGREKCPSSGTISSVELGTFS